MIAIGLVGMFLGGGRRVWAACTAEEMETCYANNQVPVFQNETCTCQAKVNTSDQCMRLPAEARETCWQCMYLVSDETSAAQYLASGNNPVGFWTGIGCISTRPETSIQQIIAFTAGVAGFFVVIQILLGAFELMRSRGDPGKLQSAKDRITSSVIALLFVIFSVALLEFIAGTVLHLPGFFDASSY